MAALAPDGWKSGSPAEDPPAWWEREAASFGAGAAQEVKVTVSCSHGPSREEIALHQKIARFVFGDA